MYVALSTSCSTQVMECVTAAGGVGVGVGGDGGGGGGGEGSGGEEKMGDGGGGGMGEEGAAGGTTTNETNHSMSDVSWATKS